MKQLQAWTGSADSTIASAAVMAMAEKFNTGQEVCLHSASQRGHLWVTNVLHQRLDGRGAKFADLRDGSSRRFTIERSDVR